MAEDSIHKFIALSQVAAEWPDTCVSIAFQVAWLDFRRVNALKGLLKY